MKMNEKDAAFMSFIPVEMKMGEDENQNPQALISKLEKVGNRPSPYFSPQGPSKALALTVNALDKT